MITLLALSLLCLVAVVVFCAVGGVILALVGLPLLVLLGLGAGQIARIFILPLMAHSAITKRSDPVLKKVLEVPVMEDPQFFWIVVFLCLSAVCCIVAGAISVERSKKLAAYNASLSEMAA